MLRYFKKVNKNPQSGLPGLTLEEKERAGNETNNLFQEQIAKIRYRQSRFYSESPNIILVNISSYAVVYLFCYYFNSVTLITFIKFCGGTVSNQRFVLSEAIYH